MEFYQEVFGGPFVLTQKKHDAHNGIDFVLQGTSIVTVPLYGIVVRQSHDTNFGNYVSIYSPTEDKIFRFGHFKETFVKKGQMVGPGTPIGIMGNTGRTRGVTGIHVHFDIIDFSRQDEENPYLYKGTGLDSNVDFIDPLSWLDIDYDGGFILQKRYSILHSGEWNKDNSFLEFFMGQ